MVGVGIRLRVLPIAAMVSCAAASAQDAARSYAAVVCTSEANGPWTVEVPASAAAAPDVRIRSST